MGDREGMVIPVGMSPVQTLRLLRSFPLNHFEHTVLAVSKETVHHGSEIAYLMGYEGTDLRQVRFERVEELIGRLPSDVRWNLMIGPGTKHMTIGLWAAVINATGVPPRIWVDHRRRSKSGNAIEGEFVVCLQDQSNRYEIARVEEVEACATHGIGIGELHGTDGLTWRPTDSKFVYKIEVPPGIKGMTRQMAREWEDEVITKVDGLRRSLGRHALEVAHEPLPSSPLYWLKVKERLKDLGIRGGSK